MPTMTPPDPSDANGFAAGRGRVFPHTAREAAFLLGGIGTGNFSVGARGELRDWEIWNRPDKGSHLPNSFFAVRVKPQEGPVVARVLEAELQPPHNISHGYDAARVAGLPRFPGSFISARYPFVTVDFIDPDFPVRITMEAFTPFIPLDAEDSGIPAAVIRYKVRNQGTQPLSVSIAGSLSNLSSLKTREHSRNKNLVVEGRPLNEARTDGSLSGLFFRAEGVDSGSLYSGTMALSTYPGPITWKRQWLSGGWWDGLRDFWDDFTSDGALEAESSYKARNPGTPTGVPVGSICMTAELALHEEKVFPFIISWSFPNRVRDWNEDAPVEMAPGARPVVRNWYASRFPDAWTAARHLADNLPRLEKLSREFADALYGSTLPAEIIDAAASNLTVLRSPTCFRLETGEFLSYEGCFEGNGCCEGNCTHVWNYAQSLAFLFPELERSMRRIEFGLETDDEGKMSFRTHKVMGLPRWEYHPAVDGQLGSIVRLYRDWKLSADDAFLRALWPKVVKALEYSFKKWDSDGDGILDSEQHNTYDIEFHGPNSLANSMFCAALQAAAEMAEYLGEPQRAERYRTSWQKCSKGMDAILWNGEYYEQKLSDVDEWKYQYGSGCLSDQLFGQLLAHVAGLGYVLPEEHVKAAVAAVYRHNFLDSMRGHECLQRTFALNDESGLVLCTWPRGGRPLIPFPYSDEVWTGVEYQVAAHLIMEGMADEGLAVVKAVRDRHDGVRRNPWDEVECGRHYVRSMASWALVVAWSGFRCDLVRGRISFAPAVGKDDFRTFFSTGKCWGIYERKKDPSSGRVVESIDVKYGSMKDVEWRSSAASG